MENDLVKLIALLDSFQSRRLADGSGDRFVSCGNIAKARRLAARLQVSHRRLLLDMSVDEMEKNINRGTVDG